MTFNDIREQFERIGARVTIAPWPQHAGGPPQSRLGGLRIEVCEDADGPYFDVKLDSVLTELRVVETKPQDRHLVLAARQLGAGACRHLVCGHDGQAWFVAAKPQTPESADPRGPLAPKRVQRGVIG